MASLVPELLCSDIAATIEFYTEVLGFHVAFARPAETFVYLTRDDVELMFEQFDGPGRRWITGPLERPFGRGVNLQIACERFDELFARVINLSQGSIYLPLETKDYQCGDAICRQRQFIVQDPDGYLLRFAEQSNP